MGMPATKLKCKGCGLMAAPRFTREFVVPNLEHVQQALQPPAERKPDESYERHRLRVADHDSNARVTAQVIVDILLGGLRDGLCIDCAYAAGTGRNGEPRGPMKREHA